MTRILAEIPLWALVYPPTAIWAAWLWLRARKSGQSPFDAFPAQFPLALAAAIYLSTFRWHGGDDIPNSLLPFSLLRHGTLSMEPFRAWFMEKGIAPEFTVHPGGILISIFPVMPALLALPFFLPAVLFTAQPPELLMHGLSKVSASFLAAASVAVFHLLARERASPRWAAAAALFFAFGTYSFSVHLALVEVDEGSGQTRVLKYVTYSDVGRAINPLVIEGQVHGGVAMGIGYALTEEIKVADGVSNASFATYLIPTSFDAPGEIEVEVIEDPEPTGPFGAKGFAEGSTDPVAAAIANAVSDAIGIRVERLPMTGERIYDLLHPPQPS